MRRVSVAALGVLLVATHAVAEPPSVEQVKKALAAPGPGWTLTDGPQIYAADELWQWLDGEATELEEYRLKFAVVALYTKDGKAAEAGTIVAETPIDAFGAFSRSHGDGPSPAPFVNAGAWDGARFHIWRGHAYLRVQGVGTHPADKQELQGLAAVLAKGIPAAEELPLLLRLLPQGRLIPLSAGFSRANIFGREELRDGVKADYRGQEEHERLTLWVLDCKTPESAAQAFSVLAGVLGKQAPRQALGDEAFAGVSNLHGPTLAMRKGRFVAAVVHAKPRDWAEALLRMVSVRIDIEAAAEG